MKRGRRTTFAEICENLVPRQSAAIQEKETVLIVGEGKETEPNYFLKLKEDAQVSDAFAITVKGGSGGSPTQIVDVAVKEKRRADERGESYDYSYCLMDVEGPGRIEMLPDALAIARGEGITVVLSNPSFECWYILHFERTCRAFNDGDAVVVFLNTHWRREFGQDYRKEDDSHYRKLESRLGAAVANARQAREHDFEPGSRSENCNSCTEIYGLIEKLRPSPLFPARGADGGVRR